MTRGEIINARATAGARFVDREKLWKRFYNRHDVPLIREAAFKAFERARETYEAWRTIEANL